MALIANVVVPTLVRVTVLAGLVTPVATEPKFRVVGASLAVVPVPLSGTSCGLPVALSVMLTSALRAPEAVGLKSTLTVQVAPVPNEVPQVVAVLAKSPLLVPVIAMVVMVNEALPVFFKVTVLTGVVIPMAAVPKAKLVGESVTAGAPLRLKVAVTD